jgi:adenosylhomocysteine nucleosidase
VRHAVNTEDRPYSALEGSTAPVGIAESTGGCGIVGRMHMRLPVRRPRLGAALWMLAGLVWAGCARSDAVDVAGRTGTGPVTVLVSANAEWQVVKGAYPRALYLRSPWGEFFEAEVRAGSRMRRVVFFHGGWGKVAAAGSTQYVVDRWKPALLVNLGTCGGFGGDVRRFETLLAGRTIIYDIEEAMGDSAQAIADYATTIDLGWLGTEMPVPVRKTLLVSADRDLVPAELDGLKSRYGAVAGDWESGAIAYTCARNGQRVLILRGVSDLVTTAGGEAYGDARVFAERSRIVMTSLLDQLPKWLARVPGE